MNWKEAENGQDDNIKIPSSWLKLHYYEAFSILFRVENVLRIFVYSVLKCKLGKEWVKTSIDFNGKSIGSVQSLASQRISQEQDMGYISYHIHSPIMQLTAGELIAIIFSDSNWPMFKDFFPGKKDIIKHKLLEIIEVRNALAHFRPIKPEDIQLIKQNLSHTLIRVEKYLTDMTQISTRVPSNNESNWFLVLKQLGTTNIQVNSYFSSSEDWIKVTLRFTSPIIYKRSTKEVVWFKPLTIVTNRLLRDFPDLYSDTVFVSETSSLRVDEDSDQPFAVKSVHFIFSQPNLLETSVFLSVLPKVLDSIETETAVIQQEATAQGKYVRSLDARARKKGDWWALESGVLECEVSSDDPVEYWGDIRFNGDIVSDVPKYPWMPVSVSRDDFFWF